MNGQRIILSITYLYNIQDLNVIIYNYLYTVGHLALIFYLGFVNVTTRGANRIIDDNAIL